MARKKKEAVELPVISKGELTKSIGQIADECYTFYGGYVNNFRALANISDGCKVSYKRIIYAATRKDVDKIYKMLKEEGLSVERYHAGMSNDERNYNY